MKSLILNNKVVDVKETEFPVHNSMTWVDCGDDVKIGFSYDDGVFTAPVEDVKTYVEVRQKAYPRFSEFAEAYTEKEIGGDSTKWDEYVTKYNKVKMDNPKS